MNHEEFKEATIHTRKIHEQPDHLADSSRLLRLREALRTEHLNKKEKTSLLTIDQRTNDEYSELFTFESDVITATTAVAH